MSAPCLTSPQTRRRLIAAVTIGLLVGCLFLGGAGRFWLGWSRHSPGQPQPFAGTITKVPLDDVAVCVTPATGGTPICEPLFKRAGSRPPRVGDQGRFTYAYDVDARGNGYVLLVETHATSP